MNYSVIKQLSKAQNTLKYTYNRFIDSQMLKKYNIKVKCSYSVTKFKPSRQKKCCLCFAIVFPLNVKYFWWLGLNLGTYTVTAFYFRKTHIVKCLGILLVHVFEDITKLPFQILPPLCTNQVFTRFADICSIIEKLNCTKCNSFGKRTTLPHRCFWYSRIVHPSVSFDCSSCC